MSLQSETTGQPPDFIDATLAVRQAGPDGEEWVVTEPITYREITVSTGSTSDFASVPRFLVWLIPRYGRYTKSAILHDHLCRNTDCRRDEADQTFRESMADLEVAFLRRWIMWAGVRAGSGVSGAGFREWCVWLLIAIPAALFVLTPAVLILVWLSMFWLIELIFFAALKLFGADQAHRPRLFVKL